MDRSAAPSVARGLPPAGRAASTSSREISRSDRCPALAQADMVGRAQCSRVRMVTWARGRVRGGVWLPCSSTSNQTRSSPAISAGSPATCRSNQRWIAGVRSSSSMSACQGWPAPSDWLPIVVMRATSLAGIARRGWVAGRAGCGSSVARSCAVGAPAVPGAWSQVSCSSQAASCGSGGSGKPRRPTRLRSGGSSNNSSWRCATGYACGTGCAGDEAAGCRRRRRCRWPGPGWGVCWERDVRRWRWPSVASRCARNNCWPCRLAQTGSTGRWRRRHGGPGRSAVAQPADAGVVEREGPSAASAGVDDRVVRRQVAQPCTATWVAGHAQACSHGRRRGLRCVLWQRPHSPAE